MGRKSLFAVLGGAALGLSLFTGSPAGEKSKSSLKSFHLKDKENGVLLVRFKAGVTAEIKVESEKETDVDLYVIDGKGKYVARDTRISKNCHVEFTPEATLVFQLLVNNLGPGDNKSQLTHNGEEVVLKTQDEKPFELKPAAKKSLEIHFRAGQDAAVWVHSDANTDVDLYVFDKANNLVAQDFRISKDCFVLFAPKESQVFKVEVVNVGQEATTCKLKYSIDLKHKE
ncbi:MAG: hypothetical protein L0Y72_02545 [Gemmataceae bacterium]|nr:hypothetical protein [Gemmataceae bacterium]MCI0737896.1 hypothetical protein [Gemmataceae bacterium]